MPPRRKWLLVGLAVVLLALAAVELYLHMPDFQPAWVGVDFAAMEEVQLLQEYVAVDTTSGKEIDGAEWLAAQLRKHGIEPHIEKLGTGQANLWAVIEGKHPEALVLHHHIDVREVQPKKWKTPPFEATIDGPLMYGRGVFDMKGYGIAQMLSFLDVARSKVQPEYSLILLATADEETGGRLGTTWFLREHPELIERFLAVVTEGGIAEAVKAGFVRYWGVEVGQMRPAELITCAPTRTRLDDLAEDIALLPAATLELQPEVAEMFTTMASSREQEAHAVALQDPGRLLYDARQLDRLPYYLRILLQDQRRILGIREAEGGGYELGMLALQLPSDDPVAVDEFLPSTLTNGTSRAVNRFPGSTSSPIDHPVYSILTRRLEDTSSANAGPHLLSYTATDSRNFRAAGIPSYGYSPFGYVAVDTQQVDRHNEKILLTAYVDGVAEYRAAVKEIVGHP